MKEKTLALFDFDHTLYKKDSLLEFTKFARGNINFYIGIIRLSPFLILMKLGFLSNQKAKERYLTYFFGGCNYSYFKAVGAKFALSQISYNLNPALFEKLQNHRLKKHKIIIVTASSEYWIAPWANQMGIAVIGSELEIINNKITGKLASKNCYGLEKVKRIKAVINLEKYDRICVYGAGKGDREMLELSKKGV